MVFKLRELFQRYAKSSAVFTSVIFLVVSFAVAKPPLIQAVRITSGVQQFYINIIASQHIQGKPSNQWHWQTRLLGLTDWFIGIEWAGSIFTMSTWKYNPEYIKYAFIAIKYGGECFPQFVVYTKVHWLKPSRKYKSRSPPQYRESEWRLSALIAIKSNRQNHFMSLFIISYLLCVMLYHR